jgi:hypothetical protein
MMINIDGIANEMEITAAISMLHKIGIHENKFLEILKAVTIMGQR